MRGIGSVERGEAGGEGSRRGWGQSVGVPNGNIHAFMTIFGGRRSCNGRIPHIPLILSSDPPSELVFRKRARLRGPAAQMWPPALCLLVALGGSGATALGTLTLPTEPSFNAAGGVAGEASSHQCLPQEVEGICPPGTIERVGWPMPDVTRASRRTSDHEQPPDPSQNATSAGHRRATHDLSRWCCPTNRRQLSIPNPPPPLPPPPSPPPPFPRFLGPPSLPPSGPSVINVTEAA